MVVKSERGSWMFIKAIFNEYAVEMRPFIVIIKEAVLEPWPLLNLA